MIGLTTTRNGLKPLKHSSLKARLFVCLTFGTLAMVVGTCIAYSILYPPIWTERLPLLNSTGYPLIITDRRVASDVSFDELTRFLANDTTVMADYVYPNYTCGDFAVRLHDDAEAQGIRSGVVGISLNVTGFDDTNASIDGLLKSNVTGVAERGHAVNVFNTTDRGLVYIDGTGITKSEKAWGRKPLYMVTYIQKNDTLGEISVNQSESLNYSYYKQREARYLAYYQNASEYNRAAKQFNVDIAAFNATFDAYDRDMKAFSEEYDNYSAQLKDYMNRSFPDPEAGARLESWRVRLVTELKALNDRLNGIQEQSAAINNKEKQLIKNRQAIEHSEEAGWAMVKPMGIVENVETYW